jgi:hypothetical protein
VLPLAARRPAVVSDATADTSAPAALPYGLYGLCRYSCAHCHQPPHSRHETDSFLFVCHCTITVKTQR